MPDSSIKRSVTIAGHRTSISLEPEFWAALKDIADRRGQSLNRLVEAIDAEREGNLSSAIRVFVLLETQGRPGEGSTQRVADWP